MIASYTTEVAKSFLVPIPAGSALERELTTAQLPEYIPSTKALCLFLY